MPPLTLHVLPPAFGLPSISPGCIAAIAYLRYTQQYGNWIVVADAAEHPEQIAPFLVPAHHHLEASPEAIEGLDKIIHHLQHTGSTRSLSNSLSTRQQADALALASHLETRLWPLVALSLYACPDNYASTTRPCFGSILPFPESWTLPHRLHQQAIESCTSLGIQPKDLHLLTEVSLGDTTGGLADAGPITGDDVPNIATDQKKNPSIAARLKIRRRIDDLVYSALAPLHAALGSNHTEEIMSPGGMNHVSSTTHWLFDSATPSIADITALSLLSLALLPYSRSTRKGSKEQEPTLTNAFLSDSINRQYPHLLSYILPALQDAFAGKTSIEKALVSAPLTASADEEDDEGAHDDAIEGYSNLDIGSGQVEIPWRRRRQGSSWTGVYRGIYAGGMVFGEAIGLRHFPV